MHEDPLIELSNVMLDDFNFNLFVGYNFFKKKTYKLSRKNTIIFFGGGGLGNRNVFENMQNKNGKYNTLSYIS